MIRKLLAICLGCMLVMTTYAQLNEPVWLHIVYIGNSITQGVIIDSPRKNAPPVKASIYLQKQPEIGEVKYSNQGVSGRTTVDFLPETGTLFNSVKEAADEFSRDEWATMVFSMMLGTNDSAIEGPNGAPVSPETYIKNVKTIVDELLKLYPGCLVVLHRPIWYSPNTHNAGARYLQEGLDRLNSYWPELQALAIEYHSTHPKQVFLGDQEGYDYFKEHHPTYFVPEEGKAGIFYLHPNEQGAAKLGEFWGKAIYQTILKLL